MWCPAARRPAPKNSSPLISVAACHNATGTLSGTNRTNIPSMLWPDSVTQSSDTNSRRRDSEVLQRFRNRIKEHLSRKSRAGAIDRE